MQEIALLALETGAKGAKYDPTRCLRGNEEEWPCETVYGYTQSVSVVRPERLREGAACCQWMIRSQI
jgi:hypothetical protein